MKANKADVTRVLLERTKAYVKSCTKRPLENIIFPKWSDIGLLGLIFAQQIKTKEQPTGCDYPEAKFQVVLRVLNGKVFITKNMPDTYAWEQIKVEELLRSGNIRTIGTASADGLLTLSEVLSTIKSEEERRLFADMFSRFNRDLLLIPTPAERRNCVEVTEELYEAGVTYCVDSWMSADENGEAVVTELDVGDFLIIKEDSLYCIRRAEFNETHELN